MPNWVSNVATVHHLDHKVIRKLRKACTREEDPIFFKYIRPCPEDEEGREPEWRLENWGTKCDAQELSVERISHNCLCLRFETAWGPPYDLYSFMKEHGYVIFAHNFEPCNARFGYWADGEVHFDDSDRATACLRAADGTYDRNGKSSWDTDVEGDSECDTDSGDEYADY